jgi:hypothetical protein
MITGATQGSRSRQPMRQMLVSRSYAAAMNIIDIEQFEPLEATPTGTRQSYTVGTCHVPTKHVTFGKRKFQRSGNISGLSFAGIKGDKDGNVEPWLSWQETYLL